MLIYTIFSKSQSSLTEYEHQWRVRPAFRHLVRRCGCSSIQDKEGNLEDTMRGDLYKILAILFSGNFEFISRLLLYYIAYFSNLFKNSLAIHEGKIKQISTVTVTLYLIELIDVRKNTNERRIFYVNERGVLYKISF